MTLGEVIDFVDGLKPNAFTPAQKTQWLNECEGMVQTEVLLLASPEILSYEAEADRDTPLLVLPPHDKLYRSYLMAMIDFSNGEYERYQNAMQLFNAQFSEFSRWFARTYRPADVR